MTTDLFDSRLFIDDDDSAAQGPPPPPPAPPTGGPSHRPGGAWGRRALAAGVLAAVAVGGGAAGATLAGGHDGGTTVVGASPVSVSSTASQPTETLAKVAAAVQPSVVSILVSGSGGSDEGSGVILRSDGTILTNNHVVQAAASGGSITVRFSDGRTAPARIAGRSPNLDLAVIRAQGVSGLTPATLGSSSSLHVGDTVLAVGSPLGLEGSVTSGIVSALHRTINTGNGASIANAVQTDAAINPGNSGGPLVDTAGQVVGINTAIATTGSSFGGQAGNIGVGFAIPIDEARSAAQDLIAGKTPSYAVLGVQVADAPSGGALIGETVPGGAAAAAGLRAGDVVTAINGTPVTSADDLASAVRSHRPGDTVTVHFTRAGQQRTVSVRLGSG